MEEPITPRTPGNAMRHRLAALPAEFSLRFDRDERAARSPAEVHRQVMCNLKGNLRLFCRMRTETAKVDGRM